MCICETSNICIIFYKIWDTTSTGTGEESLNGGDTKAMEISALEFSHDGTKLAVIVNNCDYVQVLETESGKIITTIKVCNTTISTISGLVFTTDGDVVGVVTRSVERYDLVKIKSTESEAEHWFCLWLRRLRSSENREKVKLLVKTALSESQAEAKE